MHQSRKPKLMQTRRVLFHGWSRARLVMAVLVIATMAPVGFFFWDDTWVRITSTPSVIPGGRLVISESDAPPDSIQFFDTRDGVWVVRTSSGTHAFRGVAPHPAFDRELLQLIEPANGAPEGTQLGTIRFRSPGSSALFDGSGTWVFGPAIRHLDTYPVSRAGGRLIVHLDELELGECLFEPGTADSQFCDYGSD